MVKDNAVLRWVVDVLEAVDGQEEDVLRVLTYHRIDEPANRPQMYPGLSISPSVFQAQMAYLARSNYHFVSAQELLNRFGDADAGPLPARSVLITFDDGYKDFKENAWPVLQELNIPAILFVPTAYPDHPERMFWWDNLYHSLTTTRKPCVETPIGELPLSTPAEQLAAYKQLRDHLAATAHQETMVTVNGLSETLEVEPAENEILSWDDLRALAGQGLVIGPHTQTHPRLDRISIQEVEREISAAVQDLNEALKDTGGAYPIFAYPGGGVMEQTLGVLKKLGIKIAFGTNRGINTLQNAHPLLLNRINVGQNTTLPLLRAQLLHRPARFLSKFY
jgi:peptidoglycan/xylan/chitin deacetylase (PgdA/CDA1 family)